MKKNVLLLLSCLCLCILAACNNSNGSKSISSDYPYQAKLDNNTDILILAKSKESLDDFMNNIVDNETNSIVSEFEEVDIQNSKDAIIVESATFDNKNIGEEFSTVLIKVRNNSGQSASLLDLYVDFIDKNGDIVSSTYPQYGSILEDGQACTMDVLFEGVPYGIRIASASITSVFDEHFDVVFEKPFVSINPNI